jgi:hypothetical protein
MQNENMQNANNNYGKSKEKSLFEVPHPNQKFKYFGG